MVMNVLREKKNAKKIWIVLAILILPAFIFWGLGSAARAKGKMRNAGTMFGKKVSFDEYAQSYQAIITQGVLRWGEDNFNKIAGIMDMYELAWNRLVLLHEAARRRIKISDKELAAAIQRDSAFKRQGQFDVKTYKETLQYVLHIPAPLFEAFTRQSLMISKLQEEVTKNITLTDDKIKEAYRKENEILTLEYIASLFEEIRKGIPENEINAQDYYAQNSASFKKPFYYAIEYVAIPLPRDEKEVKAVQDQIASIAQRQTEGKTLAEIAKELNLSLKSSGLFADDQPIPGIGNNDQLNVLISVMDVGKTSQPIYIGGTCYIVTLKDKKQNYLPTFDELKESITNELLDAKAKEIARQKIDAVAAKLAAKSEFFTAAKELGLSSATTPPVKRGTPINGIADAVALFDAGWPLTGDAVSPVVNATDGYYLTRVKERKPISEEAFAKEKDAFAKELLIQEKDSAFAAYFKTLKESAKLKENTQYLKMQ